MKLNLILFGPPGSGKGTQAEKLRDRYNLLHLSTGEVIRNEMKVGTKLGQLAQQQMEGGNLASDALVCNIIDKFIGVHPDVHGVIYDGFPRTLPQAKEFDKMLAARGETVTLMIALDVSDEEVIKRIKARGLISGRADDQDETVTRQRIDVYKNQTMVVADYYASQSKYHVVCGMSTIDETFADICKIVDSIHVHQPDL